MEQMNLATKIWKHFCLVNKHRWYVFKLSIKAGIPWRGFVHDLSKYSPTEFFESVKYYNGKISPLRVCREVNGYSLSWLHHKGRNKHHFEYWEDISAKKGRVPVFMPYKYIVESVCDKIAAGMAYVGKDWNQHEPIEYWTNSEKPGPTLKHPGSVEFVDTVLQKVSDDGLDAGLNPTYLKAVYKTVKEKYQIK